MFSSGLVLEGGGLRAAYESGVTDAFIENNITFHKRVHRKSTLN